jgi:hypothetical protein
VGTVFFGWKNGSVKSRCVAFDKMDGDGEEISSG